MSSSSTLDPAADSFLDRISAFSESLVRIITAPHCDCYKANKAFLGSVSKIDKNENGIDGAYEMVPTSLKKGTTDTCAHCGYFIFSKPVRETSEKQKRGFEVASKKMRLRLSQPVIGLNLQTGAEIRFDSAKDAYEAGFGSVNYAIKKRNGTVSGYQWRLA